MNEDEENMDKSVFLIEQMNLDQQPTQQEIFERADQLEIDDLSMARQSLTKQIQPNWKPYCNRYQEVYYINLQERKAFVDHPIDMYFKTLYAKKNRLPIPNFKSFKIQQIANSIDLIDKEIQKFRGSKILNVVYEESDQHDSQISAIEQSRVFSEEMQQLRSNELKQLYQFEVQFINQNQKWLKSYKEQQNEKIRLKKQHMRLQVQRQNQQKYKQAKIIIESDIDAKNKNALRKKVTEIEDQFRERKIRMQNLLEKQLQQRRSLQITSNKINQIIKSKNLLAAQTEINSFWQQEKLKKKAVISQSFQQMSMYFTSKAVLLNQNTKFYGDLLQEEFKKMDDYILQSKYRKRKPIFWKQSDQSDKQKQQTREQPNLQQKLKQIDRQKIWETDLMSTIDSSNQSPLKYPISTRDVRFKPSLSLRLWKQIL